MTNGLKLTEIASRSPAISDPPVDAVDATAIRTPRGPKAFLPSKEAVALQIADFIAKTQAKKLHLYRRHLQTSLGLVSPLLIDLAAYEGIAMEDAVSELHPPQTWPWRPLNGFSPHFFRRALQNKLLVRAAGSRDEWHFDRTFSSPGVVIRKTNHPRGRFAIRPCGRVLGFTAAIGPCFLSACTSKAILKITEPLPEIVLGSLLGRLLDHVVDHPIFVNKNYVILRAVADPEDSLPVLIFRAKLKAFIGPWGVDTMVDDDIPQAS